MLFQFMICLALSLAFRGSQAHPFSVAEDRNSTQLFSLQSTAQPNYYDWQSIIIGAIAIVISFVSAAVPVGIYWLTTRKPRDGVSQRQTREQAERTSLEGNRK